jgi:hypothetical protein
MFKLILTFTFIIANTSYSSCNYGETLDLRKIHASVMSKIKVKNQGNYGICYAYAGASIVDFYRLKAGSKDSSEISPVESGLLSAINVENQSEEGGDICDVVNSLSARGKACPMSAVGSESRYKDMGLYFHREAVKQVFMPFIVREEVFRAVPIKSFVSRTALSSTQLKYLSRYDNFYKSIKQELITRGFTQAEIPDSRTVFSFVQKAHADNMYYILAPSFTHSIISKSCEGREMRVPKLHCESQKVSRSDVISALDHQLDNYKMPVGISYCSVMLNSKNASGLDYSNKIKSNCGPHASIVIGKRSDTNGQCQYLIRNSWGAGYKYPWETSEGDVWVNEKALMSNVFSIHVTK